MGRSGNARAAGRASLRDLCGSFLRCDIALEVFDRATLLPRARSCFLVGGFRQATGIEFWEKVKNLLSLGRRQLRRQAIGEKPSNICRGVLGDKQVVSR